MQYAKQECGNNVFEMYCFPSMIIFVAIMRYRFYKSHFSYFQHKGKEAFYSFYVALIVVKRVDSSLKVSIIQIYYNPILFKRH